MANKTNPNYIIVKDTYDEYNIDHFAIPHHYLEDLKHVIIPHGLVLNRIEKLAQQVVENMDGPLTLLCVLKGGHQVFSDLSNFIKKLNTSTGQPLPLTFEFIRAKSYVNESSTGEVVISGLDCETLRGRNVLIVEDIVDTGRSLQTLTSEIKKFEPATLKTFSLLVKRTPLSNGFKPDYIGFEIPDEFIVGYCLDYNDLFRDLDHICIISDVGKKKYSKS